MLKNNVCGTYCFLEKNVFDMFSQKLTPSNETKKNTPTIVFYGNNLFSVLTNLLYFIDTYEKYYCASYNFLKNKEKRKLTHFCKIDLFVGTFFNFIYPKCSYSPIRISR